MSALAMPALLLSSCAFAPAYERAQPALPAQFSAAADGASLAQRAWWQLYADPELGALLAQALEDGFEPQLAAARIQQAEASYGIARAPLLPQLSLGGTTVRRGEDLRGGSQPIPIGADDLGRVGRSGAASERYRQAQGLFSWSLDFWGRYRSASEAARARWLASEWGRRAVQSELVSQLAGAYFELRALQRELEIAQRTQETREQSLRLAHTRERGGTAALIDVHQAEQLVYGAAAQVAELEQRLAQQENRLRELAGDSELPLLGPATGPVQRAPVAELPAGLPAQLLERRPDVLEAEQLLIAEHGEVGAARAAFFPEISLTGFSGWQSAELASLVREGSFWSIGADALQPLFSGGRLRAELQLAQARRTEAQLRYRQTILRAFIDASDALVGHRQRREQRDARERLLAATQAASRLSVQRYEGGVTSYLEVLVAEAARLQAELDFSRAQLAEQLALVEVYRALGGGWEP